MIDKAVSVWCGVSSKSLCTLCNGVVSAASTYVHYATEWCQVQVPEEDSVRVLLPQRQASSPGEVAQWNFFIIDDVTLPAAHNSKRQFHTASFSSIHDLLRKLENLNRLCWVISCGQRSTVNLWHV